MSDVAQSPRIRMEADQSIPRLLGILTVWRLNTYGYAIVTIYVGLLLILYKHGLWLEGTSGLPVYTDFTCEWIAASLALQGHTASLYDPVEFVKVQGALVGPSEFFYSIWEYPPIFLLALVPFAVLPYFTAFFTWNFVTLLGCVAVVLFIVRSPAAIAVMLAWPFAAWNFLAGQNGFFTASLLGAALLLLKRHPVLAGVFVGCLTYKPQFGILIPVALVASREWRAFASATATAMLLVGASVAAFGTAVWERFPEELIAQANDALFIDPQTAAQSSFGIIQTVYGLTRYLNLPNGPILAWIAQGATTCGIAFVVWLVWRSGVRYPLKAATLSAGALLATPYSHAYDMAALVIPVAFLAIDQMRGGLLRGEQTIAIALFGVSFSVFPTFGRLPIGPLITLSLLFLILRRIFCDARRSTAAFG